ncbi:hypothetical protein [Corallococcus llansteffanensis]|uniref:Uncharacterized protein n=1 Tax=Corallococcus llansteffanensis TaxID=2316731 RepID=A0A3A8QGJ4_9BACT|nr:hypothetical protein [Corallococcus llansteffanensis]RKH67806.1 hypothetical protein D7V93_02340 [Corallococcus llansteffanensis]
MDTKPGRTDETRHYVPTPFPEARAFPWDDLLEPTQRGLYELLSWLEAACGSSLDMRGSRDEHLSTSLLISGPRGSGKTTVLLSAVQALRNWRAFLGLKPGGHLEAGTREALASGREAMRRDLGTTLERIEGRVVWLEPLDLEPVPPGANLLATLLVRVRAALDAPQEDTSPSTGHGRWSSSILEESAEEAWGKLDHLIRDASFMWEDSASTLDTRARAEQQIKAAEIYATFQPRFTRAMEDVAKTLSLPRFGTAQGEQVILVLPIDNVDRSIEHLHNIVKLTRMVASPRLWFVLAAGHQEFQLFMERSFQKELILSGQAGIGTAGQDETLSIARRQSATTLRRALPPSYRIDLGPVDPYKAWDFCPQGVEPEDARLTLGSLLEQLRLPLPPKRERTQVLASFADLLNLEPRLSDAVKTTYREALRQGRDAPQRKVILTHAGKLALSLPARTLQDLWHAARRELQGTHASSEEAAVSEGEQTVRVATEMLRNAIDESDLPAWASQQLLNRILRYDDQGLIFLDLTGKPVRRSKRTTLSDVLEWPRPEREGNGGAEANERVLISELHLRHFHDVVLMLGDVDREGPSVPLPGNVAGWLMLLHDVLMLFEPPRVLNPDVTPFEMSPELVVTMHELWVDSTAHPEPLVQLECWWSLPTWKTFVEFAIFTAQWKAFLKRTADGFFKVDNMRDSRLKVSAHHRFILAAWVENICSVSGRELGGWDWGDAHQGMESVVQARGRATVLAPYEQRVRDTVAKLLEDIRTYSVGSDRLWTARVWLQNALPLLVRPEFAPAPAPSELLHWPSGDAGANKAWDELVAYWSHHGPRRTRLREQMVRAAVGRSGASEALRRHLGKDEGRDTGLYYDWLDAVVRTWFQAVDREGDPLEHLQGGASHDH